MSDNTCIGVRVSGNDGQVIVSDNTCIGVRVSGTDGRLL